jgi:hypothetical protein
MFNPLEDQILEALEKAGIKAQPWSGKPEELLDKPRYTPAVKIIIENASFEQISSYSFLVDYSFSILLFFKSLREEGQGAYPLLTKIVNAIVKQTQYNAMPTKIELLAHESGDFVYRLSFKANGRYVVPSIEEPLTTQINMEEMQ